MKISLVTDEISQDFETAIELACSWGIRDFEIRGIFFRRIPDISDEEERKTIQTIKRYKVNVTAISPGLFKIPFNRRELKDHLEVRLPESFRVAEKLHTNMILIFGIVKQEGEKREEIIPKIVDILGEAAESAQKKGMVLALENEGNYCWADTGKNTAQIINMVNNPALKVNWDPGNSFGPIKKPYPEGYNHIKNYVVNVHVKDALIDNETNLKRYTVLGKGSINWHSQIKALGRDGYEGYLCIETHVNPKVQSSYGCYKWLRRALSKVGED